MEIGKVVSWVGDRDFEKQNPIFGKIEAILEGTNKFGRNEVVLQLEIEGQKRQVSVFGDNRNGLVDKLGTNGDLWIGKSVQIAQLVDPISGKKTKAIKAM